MYKRRRSRSGCWLFMDIYWFSLIDRRTTSFIFRHNLNNLTQPWLLAVLFLFFRLRQVRFYKLMIEYDTHEKATFDLCQVGYPTTPTILLYPTPFTFRHGLGLCFLSHLFVFALLVGVFLLLPRSSDKPPLTQPCRRRRHFISPRTSTLSTTRLP